jgi:hypothetical protein
MDGTEPASKEDQMSAATRTTPATPDMRRAGAALAALTVAVGLVVAVGFSQASSTKSQANPVAGSAPVVHDHGWSTAAGTGQELIINGSNGGSLRYTGIPYPAAGKGQELTINGSTGFSVPAAGTGQELIINGSTGGSLRYTGIPYPAAGSNRAGVVNGTRLAQ